MDTRKLGLLGSVGAGAGLGAGLMYLFDPEEGRRRRSLARDKAVHSLKKGSRVALRTSRDLGNRTKGLVAEAGSRLRRRGRGRTVSGRWSPTQRLLAGAVGLGLLARGVANRSLT